jgi:ABC-type glycerol-3-phosphate transport system substrate-binding protein
MAETRNLFWILGAGVIASTMVYSELLAHQQPPPGPIHLTYWEKWTGFEFDAMKAVVDDFNASQNRIVVDILSISSIQDKTMMSISAGVPPDVAGLGDVDVAVFADSKAAMPLDDLLKNSSIKKADFIPVFWEIGVYDGHVFSIPTTPSATALHYNKDLFRKAGLDPEKPPITLGEMGEMSKRIDKKRPDGKLDVAGFIPAEPGWWNAQWGYWFGGRLLDGEKITANSPANVEAFDWVASYSKRNGPEAMAAFHQGFGNFSSPQNAFMANQVAMEVQGVWMYNFIHTYNPKLDWGVAPFPYPDGHPELANSNSVGEDVLIIPVGAKHPKEAFEFLEYVASQPAMEKLCMGQLKNSPLSHVSDYFWKNHKHPRVKLFYDLSLSPNAFPPPKTPIWSEYQQEMNAAFDSITLLTKTPKQALDEVTARMQPKLTTYIARSRRRKAEGL